MNTRQWRLASFVVWILYLGLAVANRLHHHDGFSLAMIAMSVVGVLVSLAFMVGGRIR